MTAETKMSYSLIPLKPLRRTVGDRLMVVGAAAGQVKPTTGGGIYYGLLCADILANTLQQALKDNDLTAKGLSAYEKEWKSKLGRELKVSYLGRKFFERLSDRQVDRIFDLVKRNGIDEALLKADDLAFDWHGQVLLRLLGHHAMAAALKTMRLPSFFSKPS